MQYQVSSDHYHPPSYNVKEEITLTRMLSDSEIAAELRKPLSKLPDRMRVAMQDAAGVHVLQM